MTAENINSILNNLFNKETTSLEEKKALMEACQCVWTTKSNKVVDNESFMKMLLENMAFEYDVEINTTDKETEFLVKTFKKY